MPVTPVARPEWHTARGSLRFDRPLVAGILNVTPDSFWDGGRHLGVAAAVAHAERLLAEGADLLDVGGESTRPGARPVEPREEAARVIPVIRELARRWPAVPISIDTVKAEVARLAVESGAAIINDVAALRLDAAMAGVAAATGAGLILMHSRGGVDTMASYEGVVYGADPVGEMTAEIAEAVERARRAGVPEDAIVLDPGLGFSKRTEHSVLALGQLHRFVELGRPVMIGPSRKRFIGELSGGLDPGQRLEGTVAACIAGLLRGARLFRVHDVGPVRRALDVAEAIRVAP